MTARSEDFHGVWRLAEWSVHLGDGSTRQPFGGEVDGHILYTPEGWMSATLMVRDRPDFSEDRFALNALRRSIEEDPNFTPSAEDMEHLRSFYLAGHGYIAYSGPFDHDERRVHHRVRVSLAPQWIGTTLSREYEFSANGAVLSLTADQGPFSDRLVWERMG